jgi:hypothetical protein
MRESGRTGLIDGDKAPSVFDPVSDARTESFTPAEMITCDVCLRANPPTRSNCLYCAATLPVTGKVDNARQAPGPADERIAPAKLNSGFYLVLTPNQNKVPAESSLAVTAALLELKTAEVEIAFGLGGPVPLARMGTIAQATTLADRLVALGIGVDIFIDDTLNLDSPIQTIRALEFMEDGLAATLMRGEGVSIEWDDLSLIVNGRFLVKRVEVEERQRRGSPKPLDSRELFSDEPLMDLYTRSDEIGFRIRSNSFDFSCLGNQKSVTAFENFTKLMTVLCARAPGVEIDDSYRTLRAVLGSIWPLEPETKRSGWRRRGAGKVDVSTVTIVDNETQFNSYSRLRQEVKLRELEGGR